MYVVGLLGILTIWVCSGIVPAILQPGRRADPAFRRLSVLHGVVANYPTHPPLTHERSPTRLRLRGIMARGLPAAAS